MMWRRSLDRFVAWLIAAVLIAANMLMLLPTAWTFAIFQPGPMAPPLLELEREFGEPASLVLSDGFGRVIPDSPLITVNSLLPLVQSLLEERRIRHLVHIATIALYVRPDGAEAFQLTGTWPARDVWWPGNISPIRFRLPESLALPPGRYEVRAMLYAEGPWGIEQGQPKFPPKIAPPDRSAQEVNHRLMRAALPGEFVLRTVVTDALEVVVDEPPPQPAGRK